MKAFGFLLGVLGLESASIGPRVVWGPLIESLAALSLASSTVIQVDLLAPRKHALQQLALEIDCPPKDV